MPRIGNISARAIDNDHIRISLRDLSVPIELSENDGFRLLLKGQCLLDMVATWDPDLAEELRVSSYQAGSQDVIRDALSAVVKPVAFGETLRYSKQTPPPISEEELDAMIFCLGESVDDRDDCLRQCQGYDETMLRGILLKLQTAYRLEYEANVKRRHYYQEKVVPARIEGERFVIPSFCGDISLDESATTTLMNALREFIVTYARPHLDAIAPRLERGRAKLQPAHTLLMEGDIAQLDTASLHHAMADIVTAQPIYF